MTKCLTVELAARHRFFRTLPCCLWLPHAPSSLHSDSEAHQPFHVCIPGTWAMSGISLLPWWDPSLLAFMELIRSHLLLGLPQITENEKVGLCSTIPLGRKEIVPTKARGHVPHNISHFFFNCDLLIFLEKRIATHSSILALENSLDGGAWWATVHGVRKSQTRLSC